VDSLGWGANFLDYDNDGVQDLFVCNGLFTNRLYEQDRWPCNELDAEIGLVEQDWSFGSAVADIDDDGDIDILVSNSPLQGDPMTVPVRLYVNHEGQSRGWVKFRVVGQDNNRFAIGALVEITAGGVMQMREVLTGTSYKSQSELTLHFGVDVAATIDAIEVAWPGGVTTRSLQNLTPLTTWTLYPPEMLADGDLDGDTDLADFGVFVGCMTAGVAGSVVPGCEMMDLMGDGDVDPADFVGFLARYEGVIHDCNANGIADLQDIVDGTSDDAANGNGVPDACETAGALAGGIGDLTIEKVAGMPQQFVLEWSGSCMPGDGDYAIYEGSLGSFESHTARVCSTQGSTSHVLSPEGAARYFLVVPNNGAREGSAGLGVGGSERSPGASGCLVQEIGSCP
jgi:hypothetical protein